MNTWNAQKPFTKSVCRYSMQWQNTRTHTNTFTSVLTIYFNHWRANTALSWTHSVLPMFPCCYSFCLVAPHRHLRDNCTLTFLIVQHVPQPAPGHPQWSQAYEPPTGTGKQQSWISFYCSQHHLTLESKVQVKCFRLLPLPQNWPLHTCGRPLQQCA